MFRQKLAAGVLGLAMMLPMVASADATTDAQNQIQTLLSQIKALQEQIRTIIGTNPGTATGGWHNASTTPSQNGDCGTGNGRGLKLGQRGDDVKNLQEMLRGDSNSGFTGTSTGFFGPMTERALKRFHDRNGMGTTTDNLANSFMRKHCENRGNDDKGKNGGMMMNMPAHIAGSITTTNGNDITVVNGDGRMVVVHVSATTTIKVFTGTTTAPTVGSLSDLAVGKKVAADGPKNADGSINAVHINVGMMLPPMNMSGMMGGHGYENDNNGGNKGNDSYTHGSMGDLMSGHH